MSGYLRLFSVFILFASIFITPSFAGEVSLPQTGQTVSYGAGDDGDIKAGVAWPSPRFKDNGDGTLTDNLTGLMWMKDGYCIVSSGYASANPTLAWQQEFDFVDKLNSGAFNNGAFHNISGYTTAKYEDWRVPNINEMESLVKANSGQYSWLNGSGFVNIWKDLYGTSTTVAGNAQSGWAINMNCGLIQALDKGYNGRYVLPVRGSSNGPARVWQTGQSISYTAGDDGDNVKKGYGASWDPLTRFIDNTDSTVTDTLTGLMWTKTAGNTQGTWADALTNVQSLNDTNYLGYNDWRLPNRKELRSLVDYSQANPPFSTGNPLNIPSAATYWTSSADSVHANNFWYVDTSVGGVTYEIDNSLMCRVWPVRGNSAPPPSGKKTLTISKTGDGTGQVTSSPSGINCGVSCTTSQASFNANAVVVLTAAPSSGSVFKGWSGDASGSSSVTNITMSSNKTITATFGKSSYSLAASVNPADGGTVTPSVPGPYAPDTLVTLTPHPAPGYGFGGWSGDASGTQDPLTVTMNKNMTITANFAAIPDTLSLGYTQNGNAVTLNASLEMGGSMMPGQQVQIFETTPSGRDVSCGKTITGPDGACRKKLAVNLGVTRTWYAKVVSRGVCEGLESSPVSCTIGRVTPISPDNKAVVTAPAPGLSWQGYDQATGYDVQLSTKPGFPAAGTAVYPVAGTTFNGEALSTGKKYFWRVIAELPTGTSMPSVARSIVYKSATNLSLTPISVNGNKGTFQATLTGSNGLGIQGRAVRITGGKQALTGKTLVDGSIIKTITLPPGPYSITATFAGDRNYAPSASLPLSGP
jgi:uncharacterized repeat protein (TIGR02543 family)